MIRFPSQIKKITGEQTGTIEGEAKDDQQMKLEAGQTINESANWLGTKKKLRAVCSMLQQNSNSFSRLRNLVQVRTHLKVGLGS